MYISVNRYNHNVGTKIILKDGSNAMRLVKGVWKKSSHNWESNYRPLTSWVSVLLLHHCAALSTLH